MAWIKIELVKEWKKNKQWTGGKCEFCIAWMESFLLDQEKRINEQYKDTHDYEKARDIVISKLPISNGRDMDIIHAGAILKALGYKEKP